MSVDRGTVNWSAPEVLRGASDYTAGPHMIVFPSSRLAATKVSHGEYMAKCLKLKPSGPCSKFSSQEY
jgi:hypothetical protein